MFTLRGSSSLRSPLVIIATLLFSTVLQAAEEKTNWALAKSVEIHEERVLDATVEAVHQATISAQTSGRVVKLNVDVDDAVNKGDVLI